MSVKMVDVTFTNIGNVKLKLIEIDEKLDLLSAGYLLQRYDGGSKPNTIKKDAQAIQHFYRFCIKNGIDLHRQLSTLTPFPIGRIEEFSSFSSVDVTTLEQVGSGHYGQRMRITWAFIKWLWLFYQTRTKNNLVALKAAKLQFATMEAGFKLYLKAPFKSHRTPKQGLSPELRYKFFAIINPLPDNNLNPWKSDRIRWRNYTLLLTMILGGARKGESLLLKLNHFALTGKRKYFEIIDFGDVDYPRSEAPSVKTLGREVELSDVMASVFEHYITVWRKEFAMSDKSMFMFLSYRDGRPLCTQTPNAMLSQLIKKHPEFKGVLSPHLLRNTFHDLLNDALNVRFSSESSVNRTLKKAPIQEYAGGWKKGSAMTSYYPRGSIQRQVAKMHSVIQEKYSH